MHDIVDILALSFRAFKAGGLNIGWATSQLTSAFGRTMETSGGRLESIAIGESRYSLSGREIPKFKRFWGRFRNLMEQQQHYLQLPVRRLRTSGTRVSKEDALVDYVIGLEALLGTEDERTELGYRFRVRGAVVLASRRTERKEHLDRLRDLYNLRSRIVHGQAVPMQELDKAVPFAEDALRRIWNWYFDKWLGDSDNRRAIIKIDENLVG